MNSPPGCYRTAPGLRIRAVPEIETYIAFAPDPARLCTLNASAWLILELCEGKTPDELDRTYARAVSPPLSPDHARAQLRAGLEGLRSMKLMELAAPAPRDPEGENRP